MILKSGGTAQADRSIARGAAGGKDARQILGDAAAGDVRHSFDQARLEQRPHGVQVGPVRREQRVADGRPAVQGRSYLRVSPDRSKNTWRASE